MIEDRWMKRRNTSDGGKTPKEKTPLWGQGKRYRARIRTQNGKELSKCFHNRQEAKMWETQQLELLRQGTWIDPKRGRIEFSQMSQKWLQSKLNIKETTKAGYSSLLKLINKQWGDIPINQITHVEVSQWAFKLLEAGYSQSHTRQACVVFGSILNYAVQDGRLARNVAQNMSLPRSEERRHRYLTIGQIEEIGKQIGKWKVACDWYYANENDKERIISKASYIGDKIIHVNSKGRKGIVVLREKPLRNKIDLEILIKILAYTGLRFGEAAALRVRHVDLKRSRLHVENSITEVSGKQVEGSPKNYKGRSVPIPKFLLDSLYKIIADRDREAYLFESRRHTALRASNVRAHFDLAAAVIGENGLHMHDLRHTAASLAVSSGANVKVVQTMLGHKSAAMTLDVYADLFDHDLDEVAIKMDQAFKNYFSQTDNL